MTLNVNPEIKIKVQRLRRGKMLGAASVEFGDIDQYGFSIKGFKLLTGAFDDTGYRDGDGNPIWVAPPSYMDNIGHFKNIFFASPSFWKELQNKIIETFLEEFSDSA